ncbi:hypothetical protein RJ639_011685 [Escallonia herrerae]|uniref:NAC domain-containing protein n=1 Tax=Escallonia herrerae TaxID=1293975 RepID=A0AA88VNX4_9ASTE|nr:hypothetical protein RJ639_011685 [Escallonia herrerae]
MDTMESCVPPGFRFHPTDEELVGYYLRKKVASQKIDLDVIRDIDLYRIEPWDLIERCRIGYEEQNEWYFFSHKDKKYPTGTRTNRATVAGFWKATGRDKAVYDKAKLIGMRKTLVFYKGRAPNGQKSDWIMHEYRLESEENGPPQEEGWVVCRAFKKRATAQTKSMEAWDSTFFYDEPSGVSSVVDPLDYITRQAPNFFDKNSFMCKQEIEADNLNIFVHADQFVQLPQLDSPSLPLIKRPASSMSLVSKNNEEEDQPVRECNSITDANKVTDWRALDKFVASQLSQEERYEGEGVSSFGQDDDMAAFLLLQSGGREEGPKLNGFLSSSSDRDIGICIFDK